MISRDELQLAARNHGFPLELLREPITPVGLHYLLIHFDIPAIDASTWRLEIGGLVEHPLVLGLDDLKAREKRTLTVTLECAGNGRALLANHEPSQPWLADAVGTARWTGTPLAPLLAEAGPRPSLVANRLSPAPSRHQSCAGPPRRPRKPHPGPAPAAVP